MDAATLLEAMGEPAFILDAGGCVLVANRPARQRFGSAVTSDITRLCADAEASARLRGLLRRSAGVRGALPGGVILRDAAGNEGRYRCMASLIEPPAEGRPARLLLSFAPGGDERFSALAKQVQELGREVRQRRAAQARLQEALSERNLLLRELHHRVKNNIHMLVSMLAASRREATTPESAAVLDEAAKRLAAVGAVHQLLYGEDSLGSVRADLLVERVGKLAAEAAGGTARLAFHAEVIEVPIDSAVPLGLVLNELLINALKYGVTRDGTPGKVQVSLNRLPDGRIALAVEDEGPGFALEAVRRRASGLGLVRGLARQLGGAFAVEDAVPHGARCVMLFGGGGQERSSQAQPVAGAAG